jgi:hypothetical protein
MSAWRSGSLLVVGVPDDPFAGNPSITEMADLSDAGGVGAPPRAACPRDPPIGAAIVCAGLASLARSSPARRSRP